ncbi:BapA/Bap/LapF family large adhesin [Sphingopyxis sp. MWB1]|uniref:BapA/Bap/LapF family large adhesin n=1 Tax=Sphingopyxis sp. MWB1 TaxID=1537715 RepID=UPI00051A4198|nr:BapA/Bap/LapF family large adhesin [Sphingopyxis sp. MWB1]
MKVYAPDGITIIGEGDVDAEGNYSVDIPPHINGEELFVTLTDAAGNVSLPGTGIAPDLTPPDAPTIDIDDLTGTIVTGTGEIGATVTIFDVDGVTVLGTGTVDGDGNYSITIAARTNGETLTAVQADAAGNVSLPGSGIAPDLTPPDAPTIDIDGLTGTIVTGVGEIGATVTIFDVDGVTVLGTGTVDGDGNYSITIAARTNGETLTAVQADATGNVSLPGTGVAPDLFDAVDDVNNAALDLIPTTTNVDLGSHTYVALLSLASIDLSANLSSAVTFTVGQSHTLDALFEYNGLANIGAASDYRVVLQQRINGEWVGVGGNGTATLLDVSLLGGDLAAMQDLGAGEYRAFMAFEGVAGLGILGELSVSGTDSDYTDIANIIAINASGNVITDVDGEGNADLAPAGTVVHSIIVNGVTTDVIVDGTIVAGQFGTLVIYLDGSYTYTPGSDAANIGKAESFTYVIARPDGVQESASLTIQIGSPDVALSWGAPGSNATIDFVASSDAVSAGVLFKHQVSTSTSDLLTLNNPALGGPQSANANFSVAAGTESNAVVHITASGGLVPTYTVTVTNIATSAVVHTQSLTAVIGVGGLGQVTVNAGTLPPGDYRVTVQAAGPALGFTSDVDLTQTVTNFNAFEVDATASASGNLLANDVAGSLFTAVLVESGGGFTEIGDTPVVLVGAHGTLTIDETGSYTYVPNPALPYSAVDLTDSFAYQIRHPNGEISQSELTVTVDVVDPGGALPAAAMMMIPDGGDVIMLAEMDAPAPLGQIALAPSAPLTYDLFEAPVEDANLLENYLKIGEQEDPGVGSVPGTVKDEPIESEIPPVMEDSLGYLIFDTEDNLGSTHQTMI